jgi:hypothetical protein
MNGTNSNYLYNDIEVTCTGRYVDKKITYIKESDKQNKPQLERFVEITPVDDHLHWTKFVSISELYLIKNING